MALPLTRDQTVQNGQTVPAGLINAIQDGIVATATSRRTEWIPVRAQAASTNVDPTAVGEGDVELANPANYLVDLKFPPGTILKKIRLVGSALAGATMTVLLNKRTYDATSTGQAPTQIGATITWTGVETEVRKEIDASDEVIILDDDTGNPTDTGYRVWITNSGGTSRIHVIKAEVSLISAVKS